MEFIHVDLFIERFVDMIKW